MGFVFDSDMFRLFADGNKLILRRVEENIAAGERVGSSDCRIAASAITSGLIIVTRNTRDYARIPGAALVDWGAEGETDGEGGGPNVPPNLSQNVV